MSKPKFTPGPWKVDKCGCITDSTGSHRVICHTFTLCTERNANQSLVSSAPDLYEAAKFALTQLGSDLDSEMEVEATHVAKKKLMAALSKAEGK